MSEIFSKVSQLKEKIIAEMSKVNDESSLKEFQEKNLSKIRIIPTHVRDQKSC